MHSGRVHVWAGRDIPPAVLRDRQVLAEEGFASCAVVIDGIGAVLDVSLVTRGVVDEVEHADEMVTAREAVKHAVKEAGASADDARIAEQVRLAVRRTFFKSRGKKPMTVVHVRRSA
jgi:ribonuclease J